MDPIVEPRRFSRRKWIIGAATAGLAGLAVWKWGFKTWGEPLPVGILLSRSGPFAEQSIAVSDAIVLAIEEINNAGGVLNRKLKPIFADAQGDPAKMALEAEKLITQDNVAVLFGAWSRAERQAVQGIVEKRQHLLLYPAPFAGLELPSNTIHLGALPNQLMLPIFSRWEEIIDAPPRVFLLASATVDCRASIAILKHHLGVGSPTTIVGEHYAPFDATNLAALPELLRKSQANAIFNLATGQTNCALFQLLLQQGFTAKKLPVISTDWSEREARKLPPEQLAGHYLASSYLSAGGTPENTVFLEGLRKKQGPTAVADDGMEAAYAGVKLLVEAVKAAGNPAPEAVLRPIGEQVIDGPSGRLKLDPTTGYARKMARLGQFVADGSIEEIWNCRDPIAPKVYPGLRRPAQWQADLDRWEAE